MALVDENKDDGDDSSSDDEVTSEQAEILEILEQNSQELKAQDRMLEKAAKKLKMLKAKLAKALEENEKLRSARPQPNEIECPIYESMMRDLCEQKSKYAHQVEENERLKGELGELQSKLDKPIVSDELECKSYLHLAVDIAELKRKGEG